MRIYIDSRHENMTKTAIQEFKQEGHNLHRLIAAEGRHLIYYIGILTQSQ
jgi:hypothetical protein